MSYIGQGLGQGQAERFVFTAAGGETSVTLDDSGRGIAYTVGQVDVYLNGVKLVNGTDFTAASGSSITGLSALVASDIVEIVALDAFSPADTVSASNGGTFSGNVTFSDGIVVDNDGATVATFDRATSDGTIAEFQKNGTTVGSIGNTGARLFIDSASAAGWGFGGGDLYPRLNGSPSDGGVQLGTSSYRFSNLYLSGGIYLGGTGAANYLDDYETGVYDATITMSTSGTVNLVSSNNRLSYVKIGDFVQVTGQISVTSVVSPVGTPRINLPFTVANPGENSGLSFNIIRMYNAAAYGLYAGVTADQGTAFGDMEWVRDNNTVTGHIPAAGDYYMFNITYRAA